MGKRRTQEGNRDNIEVISVSSTFPEGSDGEKVGKKVEEDDKLPAKKSM